MRLIIVLMIVLITGIANAQNQDDPDMIEFCKKTQRMRLVVTVPDEHSCNVRGKVAPCQVPCGWLIIRDNCSTIQWKGCKPISALFVIPTPIPTRSPRPTVSPNPCERKDPNYCWRSGASLNPDGTCFSNCYCIQKINPFVCAK